MKMGHMDDENESRFTVQIRYQHGDATAEVFNSCTEIDEDFGDHCISFKDRNGKSRRFRGVDFSITEE
jgi:hypothetical protein